MSSEMDTREKILQQAALVFAESGFKCATVRQICNAAKVNVASVNYYFTDKQNLYAEVIRYGVSELFSRHPLFAGIPSGESPELLLRIFVREFFKRVCEDDEKSWVIKLILRELIEPTGMLSIFVEQITVPVMERISGLIMRINPLLSSEKAKLCVASIMCQCVHFYNARAIIEKIAGHMVMNSEGIEVVSTHIADFSIAAIKSMTTL